jgi:hypothetical protein
LPGLNRGPSDCQTRIIPRLHGPPRQCFRGSGSAGPARVAGRPSAGAAGVAAGGGSRGTQTSVDWRGAKKLAAPSFVAHLPSRSSKTSSQISRNLRGVSFCVRSVARFFGPAGAQLQQRSRRRQDVRHAQLQILRRLSLPSDDARVARRALPRRIERGRAVRRDGRASRPLLAVASRGRSRRCPPPRS